ncbi:hypothetical protein [Rhizorhabdus sp. FW153]|uniref:hypothetical protein n=1 Tax=Rhizorhabdus sp. FW153 TaxID=3400216 RepID=UPI003CF5B691
MSRPLPQLVPNSPLPFILLFLTLLGLGVRIAAAAGDYWLDEAWSAIFARDAATIGDVLFAINHDNNHHLNTMWLRTVGWTASPMLGRALSILCGTLAIPVAGLIAAQRGVAAAGCAAALFALSPILVTYGSEARGYAPMLLALLVSILIVDRQIGGRPVRYGAEWFGLAAFIGMLAHVSMLFGVAALVGWMVIVEARNMPRRAALRITLLFSARALAAVAVVLLMIFAGAAASPDGLRMGSVTPFSLVAFVDAVAHMLAYTVGWPWLAGSLMLGVLLLPRLVRREPSLADRMPFFLLAILGLPLLVLLFQPDNSAYPRYYLLSAVGLLLLLPEILVLRPRFGTMLITVVLVGSISADIVIVENRRADPGAAVEAMMREQPGGGFVLLEHGRDAAVLQTAAGRRGYPLILSESCVHADFYFVQEAPRGAGFPLAALRCGRAFQPLASATTKGLSGMDWQLFARAR